MWIFEKFQSWTDNSGDVTEVIPVTRLLDNISLYWLTNTGTSSARLYYESFREDFVRTEISLPVAVSIFKGDSFTPPRSWGERTYSNLIYWNEVVKGGHFAAFEQPALFHGRASKELPITAVSRSCGGAVQTSEIQNITATTIIGH
jgi:hypothetical protein